MDQPRPVIGICTAVARANWGVWEQREAVLLATSYIGAIQRAGGLAVMIPPDGGFEEDPDQMLDLLDGLILAGGSDIDPAFYGAEALEAPDRRFVLGVQWHPEADERSRIVGALVEQARMAEPLLYRSGRGSA